MLFDGGSLRMRPFSQKFLFSMRDWWLSDFRYCDCPERINDVRRHFRAGKSTFYTSDVYLRQIQSLRWSQLVCSFHVYTCTDRHRERERERASNFPTTMPKPSLLAAHRRQARSCAEDDLLLKASKWRPKEEAVISCEPWSTPCTKAC